MKLFERIIDIQTGEEIMREFSAEEIKQVETAKNEIAIEMKAIEETLEQKKAVLTKMGLTIEEAQLLLS